MKKFDVYKHPSQGYLAIKNGFSWPAAFFGGLWLLYKKEYIRAVTCLAFGGVLVALGGMYHENANAELAIGTLLLVFVALLGMMGNRWLMFNLIGTEYVSVAEVEANTPDEAIAKIEKTA